MAAGTVAMAGVAMTCPAGAGRLVGCASSTMHNLSTGSFRERYR
jgi:hypothetical protein